MKKEQTALAIGGGLGIIIFGAAFYSLSKELKVEIPQTIETEQSQDPETQVDTGELATAGQRFITLMASYDQEQNQPIKLMSIEPVNNIWQAKYEVEQVFENDLSLVYYYTLDIDQGRVVRQNVAVSDRSRRLLVSNPEPDSIVEQQGFTVKGQVFDGQEQVQIALRDKNGNQVMQAKTLDVNLEDNGVYSTIVQVQADIYGEYILQAKDDQSLVEVAIIISQSN